MLMAKKNCGMPTGEGYKRGLRVSFAAVALKLEFHGSKVTSVRRLAGLS